MKYYKLWDVKDQHSQLLGQLLEALSPKSLTERLISILSRERFFNKRISYEEVRGDVALKVKELVSESTPIAIADALVDAYHIKGDKLGSLFMFTQEIIQNDLEFLSAFYNQLSKDNLLFDRIAPDLLRTIRDKDSQDVLYSSMIDKLLNSGVTSSENIFLRIFSSLAGDVDKKFSEQEIVMIKKIINSKNENIGYAVAELIPSLVVHEYSLGRGIAVDFFKHCNQSNAEYTFMYLNRLDMCSIAKELLLDHSYRFSISYDIEITMPDFYVNNKLKNV